jgi:hypothetical protein
MNKLWFEKSILKGRLEKFILIAKIKGLAEMSVSLRKHYIKNIKQNKDKFSLEKFYLYTSRFNDRKRYVGAKTRYHLLALALLGGKKYLTVERKCGQFNKPNPKKLLDVINENIFIYGNKITEEMVIQWLNDSLEANNE